MPNHYYDSFLRRTHSDLVAYRPLLADILRYDYQITEYLENYSLIDLDTSIENQAHHLQTQVDSDQPRK